MAVRSNIVEISMLGPTARGDSGRGGSLSHTPDGNEHRTCLTNGEGLVDAREARSRMVTSSYDTGGLAGYREDACAPWRKL
jgi:hypothetical protein